MQGQWNHGRAYYRCKFPDDYPDGAVEHPKSIYVKEEALLPGLDAWLASLLDDDHLDDTCTALAGSSAPDPEAEKREAQLRAAIADCDRKIRNFRQLLDDEDTVTLAAQWITETQRERTALEQQLGHHIPGGELTAREVKAIVDARRDIVTVLAAAEPEDKSEFYSQLGVWLSYNPTGNVTVKAEPRGVTVRVGGASGTVSPRALGHGRFAAGP